MSHIKEKEKWELLMKYSKEVTMVFRKLTFGRAWLDSEIFKGGEVTWFPSQSYEGI